MGIEEASDGEDSEETTHAHPCTPTGSSSSTSSSSAANLSNEVTNTIFLRRKPTEESAKIQVIETDFSRPRKPSIMKQPCVASLGVTQQHQRERRNSVTFDETPADIPCAPLEESDEDSEDEAGSQDDMPSLDCTPTGVSQLTFAVGTLQLKKGKMKSRTDQQDE